MNEREIRVNAEKTLLDCALEDPIVHCCFKMRAGSELRDVTFYAWMAAVLAIRCRELRKKLLESKRWEARPAMAPKKEDHGT